MCKRKVGVLIHRAAVPAREGENERGQSWGVEAGIDLQREPRELGSEARG